MTISSRVVAAFGLGMLLLPTAAAADSGTTWGTHWLNARQAHQDARTDAGIANGSLTGREVARIERHDSGSTTRPTARSPTALSAAASSGA